MKGRVERIGDTILGSRFVSAAAAFSTRHDLRILAYHDVEDTASFERQMALLRERYVPVPYELANDALSRGASLPARAVWVTFDDGSPTVVELALPIMARYGIPSTMFVCPGVIDTDTPFWWQAVEQTWSAGIRPAEGSAAAVGSADALVAHLKTIPDMHRRTVVSQLVADYEQATGAPPRRTQLTKDQVGRYLDGGGTIGNHTVDHPCLDTCTADAAALQVEEAHEELERRFGILPTAFAYPNGNYSPAAERALEQLGYNVGLLFDHAIVRRTEPPLRASRLRVDDRNTQERFRAIVSGSHPASMRLRRRLVL